MAKDSNKQNKKSVSNSLQKDVYPDSFVHLHVHTHYSLLKSSCSVSAIVDQCLKYNQPAVAITDYGNMFGALDLYFKARDKGIKPLLGLEIYLASESYKEKNFSSGGWNIPSLVLLAQDIKGYRNLCKINTIAFQEGFYYVPRVNYEVLNKYSDSVIALTGGLNGILAHNFFKKGPDDTLKLIYQLKSIYKDRLYLQLNRTGLSKWESINSFFMEVGHKNKITLTAGNDVHYLHQKDSMVQDVLLCIGTNRTLKDPERFRLKTDQFYFKDSNKMRSLFKDIPEVCDSTLEISSRCHLQFQLNKDGRPVYHLPKLKLEESAKSPQVELEELSNKGLIHRWKEAEQCGKPINKDEKKNYLKRLNEELKIIINMGFSDYFLIVYDFVHWAKKQDIPVGPGRGSGASSLVAYCLGITDLDPMPYHLLFERFLNPERISMPDFDIDFCQEHRNKVIDYVSEKYGKDYVAQVMTYGRLQARAAIRDVGRVLGMSYTEVDQVAKLIPEKLGITLEQATIGNPRLNELIEADPQISNLINLAKQIEGLIRHVSIHAAGVIIADHPILHFAPLYRGTEGENIIQCDLNHSKKIGLIKFDFLGLKTLTQINYAFQMIEENQNKKLSVKDISLEDEGVYEIMCRGDTKGVFQFEGEGITDLIIKAQPSCFEDIVAINALFRPGPMDMISSYLDRKKGRAKMEYLFPELESILKETYGVIVYQEQVLLIAAKIAGYSYGEADVLRRAMGEKKSAVMKKQKNRFLSGAKQNKYDFKKAEKLFDLVAEFAKYGFNKSHAAAYCVLAAQTAWIKHYYPVEFFASILSMEINNTDKIVDYMSDAKKHNIKVLPPSINYSGYLFTPREDHIYFSLGAIKGVGKSAVDHIIAIRDSLPEKKFYSVYEFFKNVDIKKINKKCVEALVKAGAFDSMDLNRQEIFSNYESILEQIEQKKTEQESGQINLFSTPRYKSRPFVFKKCMDWSDSVRLSHEKQVIGFYLSGHPLDFMEPFRAVCSSQSIKYLNEKKNKALVCIWGTVNDFREIITRKGMPMAFVQLEDNTGVIEIVVFSDVYLKYERILRSGEPLVVSGHLSRDEKSRTKLMAREIQSVNECLNTKSQKMVLHLNEEEETILPDLKKMLEEHRGSVPLYFCVNLEKASKMVSLKSKTFSGVSVSSQLIEKIKKTVGSNSRVRLF